MNIQTLQEIPLAEPFVRLVEFFRGEELILTPPPIDVTINPRYTMEVKHQLMGISHLKQTYAMSMVYTRNYSPQFVELHKAIEDVDVLLEAVKQVELATIPVTTNVSPLLIAMVYSLTEINGLFDISPKQLKELIFVSNKTHSIPANLLFNDEIIELTGIKEVEVLSNQVDFDIQSYPVKKPTLIERPVFDENFTEGKITTFEYLSMIKRFLESNSLDCLELLL